jgi:hypothetical protein
MLGLSCALVTGAAAQTDNPFVRGMQNAADIAQKQLAIEQQKIQIERQRAALAREQAAAAREQAAARTPASTPDGSNIATRAFGTVRSMYPDFNLYPGEIEKLSHIFGPLPSRRSDTWRGSTSLRNMQVTPQ